MYLSHYNLTEKPFQISTDPKFLWLGEKHREALAVLKYGIINNQGFVLLTGDVGTGKTTLINALGNSLDRDTIVAVISDPKLDKLEFFNLIAKSFKFKKSFNDKLEFTTYFGKFLNAAYREDRKVLLIIDEAQNISLDLLEEIRLLSNIEIPERKLLNIFFIGQNEFNTILTRKESRALRQRITVTYDIKPLTESESGQYIAHRLKVAGASKEIFNKRAIRKIYSFSKGYPRLINIICDHALLTGYVKDGSVITPKIIKECTRELSLPGEIKKNKARKVPVTRKEKESKSFRKRAALYSCLLLLLIPLVYPPVSTALKGYLINVISFYDQLFEQFSKPAHSGNAQVHDMQKIEEISVAETLTQEQANSGRLEPPLEETKRVDRHAGKNSTNILREEIQSSKQEDCGLVIPFDYNSNEIPESAHGQLKKCAWLMLQDQSLALVIRGYTDKAGSKAYNKKLSAFRANMVKSYFINQGVSPTRVRAIGMGENDPSESVTEEGRRDNRRVEVELVRTN